MKVADEKVQLPRKEDIRKNTRDNMFSIQDIENLCRSDLQSLAKKHGIKANGKTTVIRAELIKKLVSRDDNERFEECSINNQGLEE